MSYRRTRPGGSRAPHSARQWPDALFRLALLAWLVFGLTSIIRNLLTGASTVANVLLVAWGVVVIVILWLRLGPRRRDTGRIDLLR